MLYRRLRGGGRRQVLVRDGSAAVSDREMRDYLLCEDCEGILSRRGEQYVGTILYKSDGDCPLFKIAGHTSRTESPFATRVARDGPGGTTPSQPAVRAGARRLNRDALVHFALGVIWRFSVSHHPAAEGFSVGATLDEQLRRYLFLGEAIPLRPLVQLEVLDLPRVGRGNDPLLKVPFHSQVMTPRWARREPDWSEIRWLCQGFVFRVFVGRAPSDLTKGALNRKPPWFFRFVPPWDHLELPAMELMDSEMRGKLAREFEAESDPAPRSGGTK
jgi:hypothetical protein